MKTVGLIGIVVAACAWPVCLSAQTPRFPDWPRVQEETLRHFQALVRLDTSNPPGNEKLVVNYLKEVLDREGISSQTFALEPDRPNLVARLKGNGRKQPILIMGHTDVVTVDPKKWSFPPFSAARDGGYIYGRGTLDDRPHVAAGLMTLLLLKRLQVPLDRDVIFLAEAGEESTTQVGIDFMVREHLQDIAAEYCLAEGGRVTKAAGRVTYAGAQTSEKIPRAIELTARGTSGHASIPLRDNAVVQLSEAVAAVGRWSPPVRLNETTREFFRRLADTASGDEAARYRAVLSPDSPAGKAADEYFQRQAPRYASMLRTSISPTIVSGGYRVNVIPSEAKATLDVRMLPDEDPQAFLETVRKIINNPAVQVAYAQRSERPSGSVTRLDSELFKVVEAQSRVHYEAPTIPEMGTGATDMAQARSKAVQCLGVGPASDIEDGPKGFGAHSDQERISEQELHRFIRFVWDVVLDLAQTK